MHRQSIPEHLADENTAAADSSPEEMCRRHYPNLRTGSSIPFFRQFRFYKVYGAEQTRDARGRAVYQKTWPGRHAPPVAGFATP
jgi:hypothetical protein